MLLYTTLSSLKNKLWIATENTDSDTELNLIIEQATKTIDSYLWFNLEIKNITERVDWTWKKRIYLKNIPNTITSIKNIDGTIFELDYIDWYTLYLKENTANRRWNMIVEYTVWYIEVPFDIENICLDLCTILVNQNSSLSVLWSNMEKLIDKNIKTQKLWELMITYFWDTERNEKSLSSFEFLSPSKNIENILNKYKSFIWLHY